MGIQSEITNDRMEETRSQLAEKLETLEDHVSEKVQSATLAVSDTVEAVKKTVENVTEAVTEKVKSVGATFDLPLQTDRHPWVVFGGAVALGCLAAQLFGDRSKQSQDDESPSSAFSPAAEEKKSWLGDQLNGLKGLAVNAVMKVVRDLAKENLPEALAQRIGEEADHLARKLGGG